MRRWLVSLSLLLVACSPVTPTDPPTRAIIADSTLPPMKSFARAEPILPQQSNADLVRDFLDLHFQLESGRELPRFTRFEGPITLRVTGDAPASLDADLDRLIGRLRDEAGIDIRRTAATRPANITVEAVPRDRIRRALPHAACFVVPGITRLADYRAMRRSPRTNWTALKTRERLAIFVPSDSSPQEVRDCLHEELAQALGPLNDLYRLPSSVFNDDNVHTVLTGYDMLILRATYAPELRSGMTRPEVAARLPGIFARLNPDGDFVAPRMASATPRAWASAIQTALGPGTPSSTRRAAADRALIIAQQAGWQDHRLAFSHYAKGRLSLTTDPEAAQTHFRVADRIYYRAGPDTRLHRAYVATQLAAHALTIGDGPGAQVLVETHLDAAAESENAALLSTLMLIRAEALSLSGQSEMAHAVRLDSLGWARYGFGPDWAVRAKMREIARLAPPQG